jgi:hypothetical protein
VRESFRLQGLAYAEVGTQELAELTDTGWQRSADRQWVLQQANASDVTCL